MVRHGLSQGLGFVTYEKCPFCGQGISGNELIAVYHSHFDVAYKEVKQEVAQLTQRVINSIGESSVNRVQQKLSMQFDTCRVLETVHRSVFTFFCL